MTPLILETSNQEKATTYLKEENLLPHLVYEIDIAGNIGVDDIKALLHQASYRLEQLQVYLIRHADKLTLPAQNMLLKTLEEAPASQLFVLTTPNRFKLLETVLSRCQIITLKKTKDNVKKDQTFSLTIIKTLTTTQSNCISLTDQLLKIDPQNILKDLIFYLHQSNRQLPTLKRLKIINYALSCLSDLQKNVNPKLALDHFLLKSQQLIKMKPADA